MLRVVSVRRSVGLTTLNTLSRTGTSVLEMIKAFENASGKKVRACPCLTETACPPL